ncbi:lipoyl domain-containing protein [Pseudonocardia sp. NPDC049154]|uniref:lipoyl domain-containing protein n=1 Tax=Pseudonocardia sp. NPDC049154 TaxID=3155501 RepID=UPI0033D9E46E
MSTVQVRIPKLGMSMQEGRLTERLIPDGGRATVEEPLYVLETEKVEQEIDAPATGTVRWLVEEDEDYEVGTLVAEIEPTG